MSPALVVSSVALLHVCRLATAQRNSLVALVNITFRITAPGPLPVDLTQFPWVLAGLPVVLERWGGDGGWGGRQACLQVWPRPRSEQERQFCRNTS